MGFVGLRIAGAVALMSATGALAGALFAYGLERSEHNASEALSANLDVRVEAGRVALAAILEADAESQKRDAALAAARKNAAAARAKELLALAQNAGDLGAIPLAKDESLDLVAGANEQAGVALALGLPREDDGKRIAARVRYEVETPPNAALGRALGAIVNLGDAPKPFAASESRLWVFLFAALATAMFAFVYARFRIGAPIEATLDRARALAHGDGTRANESRGGRDARELARAVNALVDRAERLKSVGREARDEDVSQLVRTIETLAQGELGTAIPNVGEALQPLARALDRTSRDLADRVRAIRELSTAIADSAADVAPAAKKISAAALDQAEALSSIGATAQEAATEVHNSRDRLAGAMESMRRAAAQERKVAQDLRAALLAARRRLDPARHPMSEEEMKEAASALEVIASSLPEAPPSVDTAIAGNLTSAAAGLVRIAETIARALRVLERSAHASFEGANELRGVVTESTELAVRLGSVLAGFAAGASFEAELIERLERWREEAKLAILSSDGLTDEGRALVRQVLESSEGVRARLARMVSATESAIDVLRR